MGDTRVAALNDWPDADGKVFWFFFVKKEHFLLSFGPFACAEALL